VCGDCIATPVGHALDRRLERRVLERLDLAAVVADEVVVMVAAGVRRLEARDAVSQVDALNEPERVEPLERPVHARDADPASLVADALVDLLRGQAAVLGADELDDEAPRRAAAPARLAEPREGVFRPHPRHADNDTRSQRRATVRDVRALVALFFVVLLVGCGDDSSSSDGSTVVASFYPLAWAAERIAGPSFRVVNLTPAGAEPHDLELTPSDVEAIRNADLVIYIGGGFQPAVEDALAERDGPSIDVLPSGVTDPHIWLDPVRFSVAAQRIGRALGRRSEGRRLAERLWAVDSVYQADLQRCANRVLVTTHAAFGHLAKRYGLRQVALAGLSPEAEPSPGDLEGLVDEVRASGATTVFTEPLVSSRVADTVAREAGVDVATLDPIEGLSESRLSAGEDYLSVMRSNLATLRKALGCR
jgi:zinc transport system substrate-binding protein